MQRINVLVAAGEDQVDKEETDAIMTDLGICGSKYGVKNEYGTINEGSGWV
tara:strand:+ start:691 stop:843 length:153 start_codon:yes stop_codon:yes gene_type:complete